MTALSSLFKITKDIPANTVSMTYKGNLILRMSIEEWSYIISHIDIIKPVVPEVTEAPTEEYVIGHA